MYLGNGIKDYLERQGKMINWTYLLLVIVCASVIELIAFGLCSLFGYMSTTGILIFAGTVLVGFYALFCYMDE